LSFLSCCLASSLFLLLFDVRLGPTPTQYKHTMASPSTATATATETATAESTTTTTTNIADSLKTYSTPYLSSTTVDLLLRDTTLLLRCAATYHWDQLLQFLTVVEEIVASSIRDRDRIEQEQRIQAVYRQVTATDQWGNTVLHEACYKSPPLRVIQALLTVCAQLSLPQSLFNRDEEEEEEPKHVSLTHFLTNDWSTPLMVACGTGADLDILQLILSGTQQEGDVDGRSSSSMVTVPDRRGCTPLSELVIYYELQRKSTRNRYSLQSIPLDEIGVVGGDHDGNLNNNELLSTFWAKTEALIRAAWFAQANTTTATCTSKRRSRGGRQRRQVEKDNGNDNDDDSFQQLIRQSSWISLVHGAALGSIADSCPTVLTKLICRSYPAMIGFANRQGILPIHCATAFPIVVSPHDDSNCIIHRNHNNNNDDDTNDDDDYSMASILVTSMQRRCTWIESLIHWYPRSVQTNHFPHNHRSIFCQALASGLTWHVPLLASIVLTIPKRDSTNSSGGDKDCSNKGWADFSALPPHQNNASTTTSTTSTPITTIVNEESIYPDYYTTMEHQRGHHQQQPLQQPQQGPIQLLWKHNHPQILSTRDVVTGLYPFCLAALRIHDLKESDDDKYMGEKMIHGNSTKKRKPKKRTGPRTASILSLYQLDTIYALLRLHPQLIQEGIR
jgi:hypothetical protein